ncbi:MAG: LysM peptidoglycan-binding domain-containing protein [Hyphomicrobiaceae bacterium]
MRMRSRRGLATCCFATALAACVLAATQASAAKQRPVTISGKQLLEFLPGTIMHFDTPIGSVVRVTYGERGAMRGRAPNLSFYLGASSDRGRWWVKGRKLCQKWRVWFKGQARCFHVRKKGRRIFWVSNTGETGTARIASRRPVVRTPKTILKVTAAAPLIIPPKPKLIRTASIAARPSQHANGFERTSLPDRQPIPVRIPRPALADRKLSSVTRTEQNVPITMRTLAKLQSWFNSRSRASTKKRLATSSRMALGLGLPADRNQHANSTITVRVRPGDTLFALAKKHGSSVREIMLANRMTSTFLRAGQALTIPNGQ